MLRMTRVASILAVVSLSLAPHALALQTSNIAAHERHLSDTESGEPDSPTLVGRWANETDDTDDYEYWSATFECEPTDEDLGIKHRHCLLETELLDDGRCWNRMLAFCKDPTTCPKETSCCVSGHVGVCNRQGMCKIPDLDGWDKECDDAEYAVGLVRPDLPRPALPPQEVPEDTSSAIEGCFCALGALMVVAAVML